MRNKDAQVLGYPAVAFLNCAAAAPSPTSKSWAVITRMPLALRELAGPLRRRRPGLHGLHCYIVLVQLLLRARRAVRQHLLRVAQAPVGDGAHHCVGAEVVVDRVNTH